MSTPVNLRILKEPQILPTVTVTCYGPEYPCCPGYKLFSYGKPNLDLSLFIPIFDQLPDYLKPRTTSTLVAELAAFF